MVNRFEAPNVRVPDFDFSLISLDESPEPVQNLIVACVELAVEQGWRPTLKELKSRGVSGSTIVFLCGSYTKLLHLSGYRPGVQRRITRRNFPNSVTREQIINTLQELAQKHGSTPSRRQIEDLYRLGEIPFGGNEIVRLFGKRHNNAIRAAGLEVNSDQSIQHTKASVAKLIANWIESHGRAPVKADFCATKGLPSAPVVIGLFDGLDNALIAAGHAPNTRRKFKHKA